MTTNSNSSIKILVVDDEPELLQITELLLKKENYNVSTATSGQGCLNAISANKPDLLILDVMLTDINGIEICKTIKNNPRLATIYIFLISGFKINTENISEGLELGADGYLIKPIRNREILARVESAVRIIRTEKALRESEDKYRNLFEYMEDGLLQADVDGVITLANNAMAKMFNYNSPNEMLGMLTFNLFKNSEERADLIKELKANEKVYNYEVLGKTKQGNDLWILGNFKVIYNQKGERIGTEGLFRDITDRKLAEIRLRDEKDRIRTILDMVGDPIFVKDNNHRITLANKAFYDIFCLDESQVIGFTLVEAVPEDERHHFLKVDRDVLDTGIADVQEEELTVKGNNHHIITRKTRFIDESGAKFMVGSIHDITERKKAEDEIKKQLDELRRWYNVTLDREGRVIQLKQEVNELLKQHGEGLRYKSINPDVE